MLGGSPIVSALVAIGIPGLAVLFYVEGLIVGKLFQPGVAFVGFVAATTPELRRLGLLVVLCVLAATLGQWALYRAFDEDAKEIVGLRSAVPYLETVPERAQQRVGEKRLKRIETYLDQYGVVTIVVVNSVPLIRGIPSIAAGTSGYPHRRFLLASAAGNVVYFCLLSAVALTIGTLRVGLV